MASGIAHIWIRCEGGELVRSDVITWLRSRSGQVETARPDGSVVQLAGPGCPPDFHLALLRALASEALWPDNRRTVILSADSTSGAARWVSTRLGDPTDAAGHDG